MQIKAQLKREQTEVIIISAENTNNYPQCLCVHPDGKLEWVYMERLTVTDEDISKKFTFYGRS